MFDKQGETAMHLRKSMPMPEYYIDQTGKKCKDRWITSLSVLGTNIKALDNKLRDTFSPRRKKHSGSWGMYFRGQDNIKHDLRPSLGREHWYAGKCLPHFDESQERNLLHRFRRASYNHFGRVPSAWEALLLARHYGLPTRLLDWTRDPYVALYFACVFAERPKNDGALWVLVRNDKEDYDINVLSEESGPKDYKYAKDFHFEIKGVKLVYPPCVTERIRAQNCLFTVQENPRLPLEKHQREDYKNKPQDFDVLLIQKWKVPRGRKRALLAEIHARGITATSLFPDIDGVAMGLWQTEVMRSGKRKHRRSSIAKLA
jgi:hypothetical protein